ncbi:hypothetical protein CHGG_03809 [Chaetomium globosum CBS 148.51]|uniref:Postreplication repair E3 ubiquitin-protein ligase RAD18 n=1 Tax=Chaetomium globosum (strain ATCC 6205 / CBS 148.51 / DSM 1962 / NBRC 6347 / NRRL 1970) TaxID=306901 RepID=Q2H337_CHAGB|nr:uncharacterized protein CHGG_03809 [Chaetomium globosum CBS 148.51]EAQ87190.1 hypothetical protein CHGG_03809 [Chaetomium globosum CBS 148.51]
MESFDVPDSTDWIGTPLAGLMQVEQAFRCHVCKDFYNSPMITSCSHTFCSICIRRCLSVDGKCPLCRALDQESKLRGNWALREAVDAFVKSRNTIMQFATTPVSVSTPRSPKRKATELEEPLQEAQNKRPRMTTRSSKAKAVEANAVLMREEVDVVESEDTPDYEPEPGMGTANDQGQNFSTNPYFSDDGLVACPICWARMKSWQVDRHIDNSCPGSPQPQKASSSATNNRGGSGFDSTRSLFQNPPTPTKAPERLPALAYSMLKDTALRKKMGELGLSTAGSRQMLEKRHQEWITLWNANCDSAKPKKRSELMHDLEVWERTMAAQKKDEPSETGEPGPPREDGKGVNGTGAVPDLLQGAVVDLTGPPSSQLEPPDSPLKGPRGPTSSGVGFTSQEPILVKELLFLGSSVTGADCSVVSWLIHALIHRIRISLYIIARGRKNTQGGDLRRSDIGPLLQGQPTHQVLRIPHIPLHRLGRRPRGLRLGPLRSRFPLRHLANTLQPLPHFLRLDPPALLPRHPLPLLHHPPLLPFQRRQLIINLLLIHHHRAGRLGEDAADLIHGGHLLAQAVDDLLDALDAAHARVQALQGGAGRLHDLDELDVVGGLLDARGDVLELARGGEAALEGGFGEFLGAEGGERGGAVGFAEGLFGLGGELFDARGEEGGLVREGGEELFELGDGGVFGGDLGGFRGVAVAGGEDLDGGAVVGDDGFVTGEEEEEDVHVGLGEVFAVEELVVEGLVEVGFGEGAFEAGECGGDRSVLGAECLAYFFHVGNHHELPWRKGVSLQHVGYAELLHGPGGEVPHRPRAAVNALLGVEELA